MADVAMADGKRRGGKHFPDIPNPGADGVDFYTPAQKPVAGTAVTSDPPSLFSPLRIRDMVMQNRIMLSPLCQYSADDGHFTPWHFAHLGGIISRGPGLSFVEATSVSASGRITPQDSGLWKDSQIGPLKQVVDFAHSQGQKIGIQLGHAGRKASTVSPWISGRDTSSEKVGGWPEDVWGPSAVSYSDTFPDPNALTQEGIEKLKVEWAAAVKRAVKAGFDVIEVHSAHGYLLHEFLSPVTNKRTDQYGGSFENRIRLTLEIIDLTRSLVPDGMPLFLRISATDWLETIVEDSWRLEDSIELAKRVVGKIDALDVSSGGIDQRQQISKDGAKDLVGDVKSQPYQAHFAKAIKDSVGASLLVGTVGGVLEGKVAQKLLDHGLDIICVGRGFQKNPGIVFAFAEELGIQVRMPNQINWGFYGRG